MDGMTSGSAAAAASDSRELEVARQLGEHNARIGAIERNTERDISEIRTALARLEGQRAVVAPVAPAQPDPNLLLAVQALNRVADHLPQQPQAPLAVPPASASPVVWLAFVGAMALAWIARGYFPGV